MYDRTKSGETDSSKDSLARRTKTMTGFSLQTANEIKFTDRNNQLVSVWQHFKKEYPTAAPKSNGAAQICINTGDVTPGQECWFVADQLEVLPSQLYRSLLDKFDEDGSIAAAMIDFACRTPEQNRTAIMDSGLRALGCHTGTPAILSSAGINFAPQMMPISFRQISPPKITYGNKQPGVFENGQWTMRNQQFLSTATAIAGDVIFLSAMSGGPSSIDSQREATLITASKQAYNLNGVRLKQGSTIADQFVRVQESSAGSIAKQITGAGLVVLVLPKDNSQNRSLFAAFRAAADQLNGTPSVVFCEKRMVDLIGTKPNPAARLVPYIANNAIKINVRLGNENHIVTGPFGFIKENTLVLGADLVHPKQSNPQDVPSIASLVGSVDGRYATFNGSSRRTAHGEEIIPRHVMKSMAVERIATWRSRNDNTLPANIFYYRDGTGLTQYKGIREHEVATIRDAWLQVQGDANSTIAAKKMKLKVTSIVVVKRHTTRFYPTNPKDPKLSLIENCLPGTVVETHITSPYHFDFFLQSHTVEKGSAKPTHYFVLDDEMNFDRDKL